MPVTTPHDHTPATPEKIWAILEATAEREAKYREEEAKRREEEGLKQAKYEEYINKKIGSLTNLFGDLTLGMVAPKLREKFTDFGLVFLKSNKEAEINDKVNKISFEVDILLENGGKAMLVEVKTKLTVERINKHIERLEKMRRYADIHGDKRTFLGAVAGFAVTDEVREHALKEGLYLIEPDGDDFNITPPNDKPKEW